MSLLNKSEVRKHILKQVGETRPGWPCTRVSGQAVASLERKFKDMINRAVHSHPSTGSTFKQVL